MLGTLISVGIVCLVGAIYTSLVVDLEEWVLSPALIIAILVPLLAYSAFDTYRQCGSVWYCEISEETKGESE